MQWKRSVCVSVRLSVCLSGAFNRVWPYPCCIDAYSFSLPSTCLRDEANTARELHDRVHMMSSVAAAADSESVVAADDSCDLMAELWTKKWYVFSQIWLTFTNSLFRSRDWLSANQKQLFPGTGCVMGYLIVLTSLMKTHARTTSPSPDSRTISGGVPPDQFPAGDVPKSLKPPNHPTLPGLTTTFASTRIQLTLAYTRNQPNQEIMVPDWLISNHVT
eukprot:sb/3469936/